MMLPRLEYLFLLCVGISACPDNWVDANELGCLFFSGEKTTWLEAALVCESMNSSMVEILSAEEHGLLSLLGTLEIGLTGVDGWWVGLDDIGHEGVWTWEQSGWAEFFHWAAGRPSSESVNTDDCVFIVPETFSVNNFIWVDSDCNQQVCIAS